MSAEILIVEATKRLALLPGVETQIPVLVKELVTFSKLVWNNDRPHAKECSADVALEEVEKLRGQLYRICKHIGSMHKTSLRMFDQPPHPEMLFDDAKRMMGAADFILHTHKNLLVTPTRYPQKQQAQMVMVEIAKFYKKITGIEKSYTVDDGQVSGDFLDFTRSVFSALGIKAAAEYQIRTYREKKK